MKKEEKKKKTINCNRPTSTSLPLIKLGTILN